MFDKSPHLSLLFLQGPKRKTENRTQKNEIDDNNDNNVKLGSMAGMKYLYVIIYLFCFLIMYYILYLQLNDYVRGVFNFEKLLEMNEL